MIKMVPIYLWRLRSSKTRCGNKDTPQIPVTDIKLLVMLNAPVVQKHMSCVNGLNLLRKLLVFFGLRHLGIQVHTELFPLLLDTDTDAYMVNLASGLPRLLKTALGEVYDII